MFRIDHDSAVPVLPAITPAGTPGYFGRGNPVGGIRPTTLTADWANQVQEELIALLVAGGVTPVKGTNNQVLAALNVLYRPGRLIREISLASGSGSTVGGTYNCDPRCAYVQVRLVGGGGAGGGVLACAAGESAAGGGGGSGAFAEFWAAASYINGMLYQVGGKGLGASGANGGNGADSWIGSCTAYGGSGGGLGTNVAVPAISAQGLAGILPVMPGVLDELVRSAGTPGANGVVLAAGGGPAYSGHGGGGPWGGGGENTNTAAGNAGRGPGAGGSGAAKTNGGAAAAGGDGSPGRIIVREYTG